MNNEAARSGFLTRVRFLISMAMVATTAVVIAPFSPAPVATAAGPATDNFNTGTYSGGSGWSQSSWTEVDEDGGGAFSGNVRISSQQLVFQDLDDGSLRRGVDLSGYSAGATLSFTLASEFGNEGLTFQMNPGGGYQTIATLGANSSLGSYTFTIPSNLLANGTFRIVGADSNWDWWESVTIDNLEIADSTTAGYVANPDLAASCGIDVELILDESGSVQSESAITDVEDAARAFAQGLAGTTSSLRVMEFSTTGRDASVGGSTALREVDAALLGDFDAYLEGTGPTGDVTTYSPSQSTSDGLNFTNWEAALDRSQPNNADLVVFITDGVPNTVGTVNPTNNNGGGAEASALAAYDEAEGIRAAGTKLLGVGVGQITSPGNLQRLENLVEPNGAETWSGPADGALDISTVDVISVEDFEDLDDALRQVVFALCSPSVSVTKVDQDGAPISGLDFDGTVNITENGEAIDDYEWVSPLNGAASAVGLTQTDTTTGAGTALFQWVPNTVDDPQVWTSSFTFTESLTGPFAGWSLPDEQPDCSVDRLLADPDPDGPITETLSVDLIASGPNGNGTVTFSLQQNGQPFDIDKGDIVRCQVVNLEPATITIAKAVDNDGPDNDTFAFTGDLGAFSLDDTGTDSTTFSVAPGSYTVTETNPSAFSYELSNISCTDVTGQAGGTATLATRSVDIDVSSGSSITCTFTNTEVPAANLQVTKTPSPSTFPEQDGSVTYTVSITNPNGVDNPVQITAITDSATLNGGSAVGVDLSGSFPQPYPGGSVTSSTCPALIGTAVEAAPVDCEFTVDFTGRNSGDDIDDTVTIAGTDSLGNQIQRTASAEVDVTPVPPSIIVDKQNRANETIVAPGGTATYTVKVTNDGTVETVTLTGVTDVVTVDGSTVATPDLSSNAAPLVSNTCTDLVGTVLAPGESYECEFALTVSGLAQDDVLVNTVTVTAEDDDPTPQTTEDSDPAERTILGEPPAITVFKTDNDETIDEPGESIVYDIDITNQSTTEAVTITEITDEVYFTPDGGSRSLAGTLVVTAGSVNFTEANSSGVTLVGTTCDADDADGGIGTVLAISGQAGDTTSCSITLNLPGDAGDTYDDKVVVSGEDESGDPVEAENTAETPVVDVLPSIQVAKTANPTAVPEYGPELDRTVTFTVVVKNTSVSSDPLTITSLVDSDFGDLFDADNTAVASNNCDVLENTVLASGASSSPCTFTAILSGTVDTPHRNTVTVQGTDDEGNTATDDDDAQVDFTNVEPTIEVVKTAIDPASKTVSEFGGDVTYQVEVTNTSGEPVTITSLVDDKFGNLDGQNDCAVGGELDPGDTYTCTFTAFVVQDQVNTPPSPVDHVNVVTAKAVDDEGTEATDDDDETVTFTPVPPQIDVTKTDNDVTVPEPGGPVDYDITITNPAGADEDIVDITTLTDEVTFVDPAATVTYDLLGSVPAGRLTASDCSANIAAALPLAPGESVSCTFTLDLSDLTAQSVSDIVNVVGVDNDGQSDTDDDTEETPITDVAPEVQIVKTANPTVIDDGESTTYTFEITNLSTIEPLFIVDLDDDRFGSLNADCGFSVATPVELAPNGEAGDSTTCDVVLTPDFANDGVDGVHTNVATVQAADDEILKSLDGEDPIDFVTDDDDEQVYAAGSITVIKDATPPTTPFTFQIDGGDDVTTTPSNGLYPEVGWTSLDAGTYEVTELVPTDWALRDVSCTLDGQAVAVTSVTDGVGVPVGWGDDVVCTFDNVLEGDVTIEKALTSGPTQQAGTNRYDLTYTITITNESFADETFQVFDELEFPGGTAEIGTVTSSGPAVDGTWDGSGELTDGAQTIDGRTQAAPTVETITVPITVTLPGASALGADCTPDNDTVRKVINSLFATDSAADPADTICTPLPDPDVDQTKAVNEDLTSFADGVWTITYDITVSNTGDGPGEYSVVDELKFGAGVTVASTTAEVADVQNQTDPAGPQNADLNAAFDPDPDSASFDDALVSDVEIVAGATHVYRVTVTASVTDPQVGTGTCDPTGAEAGGFLNTATVTVNGEEQPPVSDCEPFSTLTLTKILLNDNGGESGFDAFPMTATPSAGGDALVEGTRTVTAALPAGGYDLAEPAVTGYSSSGWSCAIGDDDVPVQDGTDTTASVVVGAALDVACEITNDDDPVDLELTKDDGGATAVAGGDPFPYTITVSNVGPRAVDSDDPVAVVDVLPDGFEWVSFPSNALELPVCAVDGTDPSVLRCDVDPDDLGVGEQVVIQATVRALPDTPGGTYTNVAWVTTDDDPVCDPQNAECDPTCEVSCTPPPCPDTQVPGSNVGCDDTPVVHEGELDIVKVDDVDLTVVNGESFSYDISVSNSGPSPITDVVVTDDLPDGLTLTSVSVNPTHWTCNDTDPISCSYNTPLAAGPAASSITVTVTVDDEAVFDDDTIVNVAVANGDLDDEPLPPVDDEEETPLERTLEVELLTTDCLNDAPFIYYDISTAGFVPSGDITFRLYDSDDNLVDTIVQSSLSGRFVYPGAAVDGNNNGVDWPGWKLENGVWVLDDSDAILRDGLRIEVEVNPSTTASVDYPPASSACADPAQTVADLSIEKTASVAVVSVGDDGGAEQFDWTLDVANAGPDPAVDVVVRDIIPSVLTITGVSSDYFDCSTSGRTVTCTRDTMPVGASGTVTISVSLPDSAEAGTIENVGNVESNVPDPNLSNNSDDASVDVVAQRPPVTQAPPPVTLPPTGSNSTSPLIQLGLLLLAAGALGVLTARRRRGLTG